MSSVKSYKAWFMTDFSIEQIGEFLVSSGLIVSSSDETDDVYEWLEGEVVGADESVMLNIWRKLGEDEYWDIEPVNVYCEFEDTEPADELIDKVATQIVEDLGCKVYLGTIRNLHDEFYEYQETGCLGG
jgi:hypothetical protein